MFSSKVALSCDICCFPQSLLLLHEHDRGSRHHSAPSVKFVESVLGLIRALMTQPVTSYFSSCGVDDARSRLPSRVQPGHRELLTLVLGGQFRWSNKQQQQLQKAPSMRFTNEVSARGAACSSFRRHVGHALHSPLRTCVSPTVRSAHFCFFNL